MVERPLPRQAGIVNRVPRVPMPGFPGVMDRDTDHTDMTADNIAPEDRPTADPANTEETTPDENGDRS